MTPRRILVIPALVLFLFLSIYSWNQRTNVLDNLASNTGLESVGAVLKTVRFIEDSIASTWNKYINLVTVYEENVVLRQQVLDMQNELIRVAEDRAELKRLRELFMFEPPELWQPLGARILTGRIGGNAALDTVIISRGFLTGGVPGTPVSTPQGVVGRVLRAGPTTSMVLLLSDPGSRVAVISQEGRVQGVLAGTGPFKPLELLFVTHSTTLREGELLVTSGLDNAYPKGLPVAVVSRVQPSDVPLFQEVLATPLADFAIMEDVLLLSKPRKPIAPPPPVYTPSAMDSN